jgi:hypothetical protein
MRGTAAGIRAAYMAVAEAPGCELVNVGSTSTEARASMHHPGSDTLPRGERIRAEVALGRTRSRSSPAGRS